MDIRRLDGSSGVWKPATDSVPRKQSGTAKSSSKDRVDLGSSADQARNPATGVTRLAGASPEIREERVQAVKEKVDAGFYDQPESIDAVAKRMLDKGFTA